MHADVSVPPMITHGRKRDLRMTLINPLGTEVVIFNREGEGWWIPGDRIRGQAPGDEPVNGRWTLRVEDLAAGTSGTFDRWTLDVISRWD